MAERGDRTASGIVLSASYRLCFARIPELTIVAEGPIEKGEAMTKADLFEEVSRVVEIAKRPQAMQWHCQDYGRRQ